MSHFYDGEEEAEPLAGGKKKESSSWCCCCSRKYMLRFALNCAFVGILTGILALTYNRCVWCVVGVAVASALTMNCVPLTPIVFMLSAGILIMHAIDYRLSLIHI